VKITGSVIYQQAGNSLVIQNEGQGLFVQTKQETRLRIGDRVEVLGFPAKGQYTPILQDAIYRKVGTGAEPAPAEINLDEALKGTRDSQLVRIQAMLLYRGQQSGEQFLVLQTGDFVFNAYLDQEGGAPAFSQLQNGSKVAVTGVCLIEPGTGWQAGEAWRAKSFRLLLRSGGDVVALKAPPWWTLRKLLWMVAILCMVALAALTWVGVLRRRVQKQTEIIRQKLQVEAALKERYVDLFENANDAVYTHDLQGQITSMNQAGQRLLQRRREELLSRNIIDLVVPEQQTAARQWLDQVLKGIAAPTVEWDFAAASGQRVKLEISTRLVEQNGQQAEVEGIARDITERKRLERELLEISNREQRRIGHDLHDGVCQQLAGIVYLTDTLADRLQEKGATEAPDAERISRLINTAISQTRGVARGLFPVRLEENGLVSALEELAADASELFHITCQFTCNQMPEEMDNDIALHLYYIAREAVTNAAKHGKGRNVRISLESSGERYALTVQDDGIGFKSSDPRQSGMGLRIMRYRAAVIGAPLEVRSQPGSGTQVTCLFLPMFRESSPRLENGIANS
jgi:PAS domain S-box-containing protein